MMIRATASLLVQSRIGWRLTYFDAAGEPVASFWAPTEKAVKAEAARHVAVM